MERNKEIEESRNITNEVSSSDRISFEDQNILLTKKLLPSLDYNLCSMQGEVDHRYCVE